MLHRFGLRGWSSRSLYVTLPMAELGTARTLRDSHSTKKTESESSPIWEYQPFDKMTESDVNSYRAVSISTDPTNPKVAACESAATTTTSNTLSSGRAP